MRKIMFALCFMFGGIVVLSAQDTQDTTSNQYRTETQSQYPQDIGMGQPDRTRIQSTELPDEVKRSLEGEEYRGWLISGAFRAQASAEQSMGAMGADTASTDFNQQGNANARVQEGEEFFTVELKNGAETKTVHFNSDGQILQGIDEGQNSPANPYTPNPGDPLNQDPGNPNNQYNQNNQADPLNQNDQQDQMIPPDQTLPADPTLPDDPNAIDQPGQPQSEPAPGTPTPGTQPDQPQSNGPK